MTRSTEEQPEAVPARATHAGEILLRWGWVESTVWTERMLTALEHGVKGGKWFSLIDKVHAERTLLAAFLDSLPTKVLPEWIASRSRCLMITGKRT